VDLGFLEFTRFVHRLDSRFARAYLQEYPTAEAFPPATEEARSRSEGVHTVGDELAESMVEAATVSVGRHQALAVRIQIRHLHEDMALLRRRIEELDRNIEAKLGDAADFRNANAIADYASVVPAERQSGKCSPSRPGITATSSAPFAGSSACPR
jgi:hypothetical protein